MYTTPIPLSYQAISPGDITTVFGLAVPTAPTGVVPNRALLLPENGSLHYRDDGVNPTTVAGMLLPNNVQTPYDGDLNAIRFINNTAGSTLHVLYYYVSGYPAQYPLKPAGSQIISTGAVGPAYGIPPFLNINGQRPRVVWVQSIGAAVRMRDDGVDPTATTGMFFNSFMVYEGDLTKIRFFNTTTGAGITLIYYT